LAQINAIYNYALSDLTVYKSRSSGTRRKLEPASKYSERMLKLVMEDAA
jgi:hypothetical protein